MSLDLVSPYGLVPTRVGAMGLGEEETQAQRARARRDNIWPISYDYARVRT